MHSLIGVAIVLTALPELRAARVTHRASLDGEDLKDIETKSEEWFAQNRAKNLSRACARKDLLEQSISSFLSLFRLGVADKCDEWANNFVPDEVGPASMSHFQWTAKISGKTNLRTFCTFATSLIKSMGIVDNDKIAMILKRGSDVHFGAIGTQCRTWYQYKGFGGEGYHVLFFKPLDNSDRVTVKPDEITRYVITDYTEMPLNDAHTIVKPNAEGGSTKELLHMMDTFAQGTAAPDQAKNTAAAPIQLFPVGPVTLEWFADTRGLESLACGRSDLVDATIHNFFGLFEGGCDDWAGNFVPDAVGPPEMFHFQWETPVYGKANMLAFCNYAQGLIKKLGKNPVGLLTRGDDSHFGASGNECRVLTKYAGFAGQGYWLLYMKPLDSDNQVTLNMANVVKYGIVSYTEMQDNEEYTIKL